MVKTGNSDIWLLYKGSIVFHLITHDTEKNKSACFLFETKSYAVIKQHIIKDLNLKNLL